MKTPIGIFDSGVGGLTVLRVLKKLLPKESFVYFADTLHFPYGNKDKKMIQGYIEEFLEFMSKWNLKALCVACHTASSVYNFKHFPIPAFTIVEAAFEELKMKSHLHRVAILGTETTINSGLYQANFPQHLALRCPLFSPLVEEGLAEHVCAEKAAKECLDPIQNEKIDAILLACTHFPLMYQAIQKASGNKLLIDPAERFGLQVMQKLISFNHSTKKEDLFFVSHNPARFSQHASAILGYRIEAFDLFSKEADSQTKAYKEITL